MYKINYENKTRIKRLDKATHKVLAYLYLGNSG